MKHNIKQLLLSLFPSFRFPARTCVGWRCVHMDCDNILSLLIDRRLSRLFVAMAQLRASFKRLLCDWIKGRLISVSYVYSHCFRPNAY